MSLLPPPALPRPGPLWGDYPLREPDDGTPAGRDGRRDGQPSAGPAFRWRSPLAAARRVADAAQAVSLDWSRLDAEARAEQLTALRRRLRREGLRGAPLAQALGIVAACAAQTLGQAPRETQILAAAVLIDQRLAEMATGEGKTLALALAAAVMALAGMPVHVITANDYLAARDAAALAPLYAVLGLGVATLPPAGDAAARRQAYAQDVVYATAREIAFDFLRDRLSFAGRSPAQCLARSLTQTANDANAPEPLLRGLCVALLDEADSILLDEAEVPLILSQRVPHAARRAFLWQALAVARQLQSGRDFTLHAAERSATLTAAGEEQVARLAAGLGGPWQRPRYRREAVVTALVGLHACQRDAHYVVRAGAIELIDEITGRIATGRVWSRGLHTVVALKEGLSAPEETDTLAQISFQRFFQRYWRVAGLSGTLREAGTELREVLGSGVVRIPLHGPDRRRRLPARLFDGAGQRWAAVCSRVAALQATGRPVLVGTDSVADSQALSQHLHAAGIAHQVLNALHDADEAAIVSAAGRAGRVTVATRMAGRGTDIALDDAARAAGGLHVLVCQNNPSRRIDRQLEGRAGRHGDPGSTEAWHLREISPTGMAPAADTTRSWTTSNQLGWSRLAPTLFRFRQWREDLRRAARRRELLHQDRLWERRFAFAGPPR